MKSVYDIIKKFSLQRQSKVRVRAAEIIVEHKARAERSQAEKARARDQTRYKLADLIEQVDPDRKLTEEDRQWLDAPPVGKEEL
jgi:hypothetical protein